MFGVSVLKVSSELSSYLCRGVWQKPGMCLINSPKRSEPHSKIVVERCIITGDVSIISIAKSVCKTSCEPHIGQRPLQRCQDKQFW